MPRVVFESTAPEFERAVILHALDPADTVMGNTVYKYMEL
jgi:hypothetical protein